MPTMPSNPKTRLTTYANFSGERIKILVDIKGDLGQIVAVTQPEEEDIISLTLNQAEAVLTKLRLNYNPSSLQHESQLDLTELQIVETQILQTTPCNDSWIFKLSPVVALKPEEVPNARIAGCRHIANSIRCCPVFGRFYDQLRLGPDSTDWKATLGSKPQRMPNPSITPLFTVANTAPVLEQVAGLPITWLEVERLDKWGTYHRIHALFGQRHWVAQDRSGAILLFVFPEDETFI